MVARLLSIIAVLALLNACATAPRATQVMTETFMVPSLDPGINLHVRNRRPADHDAFPPERILLMVHGATLPAETAFDIDLPGGSWMEYSALRGFDVYSLELRGYGRSTRPAAMDQPPDANAPFADTKDALRDISAVVNFIAKRRGVARINLLGWSWGTALMAGYAAESPEKVEKLVLFAPMWHPWRAPKYRGAYRTTNLNFRSAAGIPRERLDEIWPLDWFNKWRDATLATDAAGAARSPAVIRAPNGVLKDMAELWAAGRSTYDPAAIRAPTLLVVGEWDNITPPAMAQELFKRLTGAKYKRLIVLSEGSHQVLLQKNRMHLIREVQNFLEETDSR